MGALRRSWSPAQLEDVIRARMQRDGVPPSTLELGRDGLPGFHHFAKHFGTYNKALDGWGLPFQPRGKSNRVDGRRAAAAERIKSTLCTTKCLHCDFRFEGTVRAGDAAFTGHLPRCRRGAKVRTLAMDSIDGSPNHRRDS